MRMQRVLERPRSGESTRSRFVGERVAEGQPRKAPPAFASDASPPASVAGILFLQHAAGNSAVGQLVARQPTAADHKDAALEPAERAYARLAGVDRHEARAQVQFWAEGLSLDGKALKRTVDGLARLAHLKGEALYEGALQVPQGELEPYWALAASLPDKHRSLSIAIRSVRSLRHKLYWDLAPILRSDDAAASGLLAALPPTELEQLWTQVESDRGLPAILKTWLQGRVASGLREAASGESVEARVERDRGRAVGEKLERRVDVVAEKATFARRDVLRSIREAVGHVDATKGSLLEVAKLYADSHQHVLQRIQRAKAEAALEEEKMDAILGIAIGVGVGLSLGAAVPLAAGASHTTTVLLETAGEVYELAIGDAVKGGGGPQREPQQNEFEKAHPALKQVEAYKQCGDLYRTLALLAEQMEAIGQVSDLAAKTRPDARELAVAGFHRTLVIPELERRVGALEKVATGLETSVVRDIFAVTMTIEAASIAAAKAAKLVDQRRIETQIWIHWLASLTGDDAELPGQEPIKTTLNQLDIVAEDGEDSVIGWGVGWWHSDENSRTGVKKAEIYAAALDLVGHEGTLVEVIAPREFEARGDFEPRDKPGGGPLAEHRKKMIGTLGKVAVGPNKDRIYTVQVMGEMKASEPVVISGVIARNDTGLYVEGDDSQHYGLVLIARPKPRTGEEALAASSDDWEPTHAI